MKSLFQISKLVLKQNVSGIRDIGTIPIEFIKDLLYLMPSSQLLEVELNSPHLKSQTNDIWKQHCIKDFVNIRILVEDNKLKEEPESWREVYDVEEIRMAEKMKAVVGKMRKSYDLAADRATTKHFDGTLAMKKRKVIRAPAPRSTSLFAQVKNNAKRISSMYNSSTPSRTPTFASAFPPSERRLSSTSSTSITPRSSITALPTAFSSTGGFISPRKIIPKSSTEIPISTRNIPVKTITRTVSVSVSRKINPLPSSTKKVIPIHSPRSGALPKAFNPSSSNLSRSSSSSSNR